MEAQRGRRDKLKKAHAVGETVLPSNFGHPHFGGGSSTGRPAKAKPKYDHKLDDRTQAGEQQAQDEVADEHRHGALTAMLEPATPP